MQWFGSFPRPDARDWMLQNESHGRWSEGDWMQPQFILMRKIHMAIDQFCSLQEFPIIRNLQVPLVYFLYPQHLELPVNYPESVMTI